MTVAVGDTEREPDRDTAPTPWSMLKDAAFAVVHESVEEEPFWMVVGFAESAQVGAGGGGGATVTPAEQVVRPPGPETVIV